MKRILFVDDEIQILKSLSRLFMDTEYEVLIAEGGEEGLQILAEQAVDLVVSDMRMPYMNGYEFLSIVKEKYPYLTRLILSGYSEESILFKALEKNIAKLYLFKPWQNDKLLQTINQIFQTEDLLRNNNLLTLINNTDDLPSLKFNYQKIIQLIESDTEIQNIALEIEKDASIASKILHIANSAYFGARTGSIRQAISYIGLQNTKNLILSTSVIDLLTISNIPSEFVENIWQLAFVSNRLLFFLYQKHLNKKLPDLSSTAGLLMNIGMMFFLKYFKEKYLELLLLFRKEKLDILELEKEHFNITHSEAGAYLLKWWEFPYPIIEAALYHHNPFDERVINRELVCAVHIVNQYAMQLLDGWCRPIDPHAFEFLGISKEAFEKSLVTFKI